MKVQFSKNQVIKVVTGRTSQILGSISLIIYINEVYGWTQESVNIFSDDTNLEDIVDREQ